MQKKNLEITGDPLEFDEARRQAEMTAENDLSYPMLISWCDTKRKKHSPACLKCQFEDRNGWEVYGENHGGKLRISINQDEYVFIYG